MRPTISTPALAVTVDEVRAAVANCHTGALRYIPAATYERHIRALLAEIDRLRLSADDLEGKDEG